MDSENKFDSPETLTAQSSVSVSSTTSKVYRNKHEYETEVRNMAKQGWTAISVKIMKRGRSLTGELPDSYVVFFKRTSEITDPSVNTNQGTFSKLKGKFGL